MIFKNLAEPKEENVNQVQLYMHYFKVPKGILLYVNKDSQDLKEFVFDYDASLSKGLLKDLTQLRGKIDSNTIPKRLADWPENWQCRYCQFKDVCKFVGPGEIDWAKFKDKIESQG